MNSLDFLSIQEGSDFEIDLTWFRGGPSIWDNFVSELESAYETAGDIFQAGYISARVAFAAPFIFGAAAMFTIVDQLHALLDTDYIY